MCRTSIRDFVIVVVASFISICPAKGQTTDGAKAEPSIRRELEASAQQGRPINVVIPIFSQVLKLPLTAVFMPAAEKTEGPFYVWKAVLPGESAQRWSQMITVIGAKEMVNVMPEQATRLFAEGLKSTCPDTFSANSMGIDKIDNNKAFGIIVACGIASAGGEPHSQTHLFIAFHGQRDFYIVQWAELGRASKTPIEFDARWVQRFNTLMQVRLCPRIPGESAPYPSCLERSEQ